jgi:PAS domain S-box-containing protein
MKRPADRALLTVLADVATAPERLRAILDERPEPLIAFTAQRKIIAANAPGERFFGYDRHELDDRPTDDIVPERLRQPDAPPMLATDDLTTIELAGLRKGGVEIATVWTFGAAPSPGGAIFVMSVLDRDHLDTEIDALRRGDARYRSLLLASASIVWVRDASGQFAEPQLAWEQYTGQPWEEHRGFGWISAIHPDDRERIMSGWMSAVRAQSDVFQSHGRLWSARHGAFRAFQVRAVPVRTNTGEILEWIGAIADVQDVVEAQEKLINRERELELRFRAVYENALDGIVLSDDEQLVVDVNPAACRLLGRERDALIGSSLVELLPPAERSQTPARMSQFRDAGMMTGEGELLLPDGSVRREEFGAVANVSPGLHLTIFRDIEDRKRAEEAAQFLDMASRLLGESLDYDETLGAVARLAVPRIADWAGVDLLESGGQFRRVAVAHVDPKKVELANELRRMQQPSIQDPGGVGAVVRTGKPELVELVTDEMIVKALADRPEQLALIRGLGLVSAMVVPLSARGRVIGAISFVSAESRRRYGAADLAIAEELSRRASYAIENAMVVSELALATRKKDEFLAMLGHEMRNPLAPIVTATALIRARGSATARELDILDRQAKHLTRLVDDLLDITRITSGKLSLQRARVQLADVLAQAVESTNAALEAKRLRLLVDVPASSMPVDGDRERLVQVITNILVNAAKFTPAGKAVYVTARTEGSQAAITVRDEGQGIAADLLPHVFDLFTQGPQATDRRHGGLGLGLALARSLVVAHGGRIEAASPGPDRGTTVTVVLPLLETAHEAGTPDTEARNGTPVPAPARARVVVVDDNSDSAELLAEFLGEMGYESFVAFDARRALTLVGEVAPDVAILDIGLPDVDGYELALEIRKAHGDGSPKLIALSGYAQERDRERSAECGFVEHLAKPVDLTRLASTLRGLLALPGG